jgi:hypothetical protein
MRIQDLLRRATQLGRPDTAEVEGTIEDVRVVEDGGRQRWLLKLDAKDDAVFVFEPTPISPPRKRGQRVRIGYQVEPGRAELLRADWVAAA